jgi:hypothetical protein
MVYTLTLTVVTVPSRKRQLPAVTDGIVKYLETQVFVSGLVYGYAVPQAQMPRLGFPLPILPIREFPGPKHRLPNSRHR